MNDDDSPHLQPAALPLLTFVAGLLLARLVESPYHAAGACSLMAAVSLRLFAAKRLRLPTALVFFSLGLAIGGRHLDRIAAETSFLASLAPDRFVEIEAPLDREWESSSEESRLRTRRFQVFTREGRTFAFASPLTLYAPSAPEPPGEHRTVWAEGFLRTSQSGNIWLSVKSPRLLAYRGSSSRWNPRTWNRIVSSRLNLLAEWLPERRDALALVQALALGRRDQLSDETRETYRRGGTYHLLVFSGMHIALAAALLLLVLRWLSMSRAADLFLLLFAAVAPLFAGSQPSVTRASWMIGLFAFSRCLRRPTSIENLYFVSALIRLALMPDELTQAGFALTYAATGGLLFIGKPLARRATNRFARVFLFGIGAELATLPLTLLLFHHYVIGGSLLTVVLGPILSLMLMISVAVCALVIFEPHLAEIPLAAIDHLDRLCRMANGVVSDLLGWSGTAPAPPQWLVAGVFLLLLLTLACRRRTRFFVPLAMALLLIPVVASIRIAIRHRSVAIPTIEILDVGQGDAILLRDGRRAVLIDGGGQRSNPHFGRRSLVPILADRGVLRLDAIALSHPDVDHCGGLPGVVENLRVGEVWLSGKHVPAECSQRLIAIAVARGAIPRLVERHPPEPVGAWSFDTLVPRLRYKRATANNSSMILRAEAAGWTLLLPGDVEKEAELDLADEERARLRADILKIPHHGAANSTSEPFLEAISPRIAVISCGRDNSFGHPADRVLSLLRSRRIRVYRTDRSGSIRIELTRPELRVETEN